MTRCTAALLATLAALLLSACSSTSAMTKDIELAAEADPKVRFAAYKSYTWLAEAAIVRDPHGQWKPPSFDADAEIKFLVDREMRARGMTQDSADPDFFVAFAVGIDMESLKLKTNPDTKMETITRVPRGGLVLALIDADTGFVAWIGVATGEVMENPDDATVKARLDYAVTKLLKKVPK